MTPHFNLPPPNTLSRSHQDVASQSAGAAPNLIHPQRLLRLLRLLLQSAAGLPETLPLHVLCLLRWLLRMMLRYVASNRISIVRLEYLDRSQPRNLRAGKVGRASGCGWDAVGKWVWARCVGESSERAGVKSFF